LCAEFVGRRRWRTESNFVDLAARGVSAGTGVEPNRVCDWPYERWLSGLAAWLGFSLPSALLMLMFAFESGQLR